GEAFPPPPATFSPPPRCPPGAALARLPRCRAGRPRAERQGNAGCPPRRGAAPSRRALSRPARPRHRKGARVRRRGRDPRDGSRARRGGGRGRRARGGAAARASIAGRAGSAGAGGTAGTARTRADARSARAGERGARGSRGRTATCRRRSATSACRPGSSASRGCARAEHGRLLGPGAVQGGAPRLEGGGDRGARPARRSRRMSRGRSAAVRRRPRRRPVRARRARGTRAAHPVAVRGGAVKLPVEVLQRRPPADRYDAVVVGAGLGGLACAAILARHGMRVAIVDRARRPGGQVQTIAYQGYAVDLAPPLWEATGVRDVLAAAGVRDVALADVPLRDALRIAIVEGGAVRDRPYPLPVPGAVPSPSVLEAVRALYGVPPRVFAALGGIYEELAHASAEQLEAWREARLVDWLADRGLEPVVASAVRRSALLLGASDPESATVAALASRGRWLAAGAAPAHVVAADNPVAGSRGVVQALVDALVEAGGDLRLGTAVVALDVERGRVRALGVQRQEQPFLEEIAAERVVLAVPEDDVLALLPRAIATQLV